MRISKKERQERIEHLRSFLVPGETIFTVLRHVSRSGMYRAIDLFVMRDNQPSRISWGVACALDGVRYDTRHDAVGVTGCGMDMGFDVVNGLSYTLHGMKDSDAGRAGYTFEHRWM